MATGTAATGESTGSASQQIESSITAQVNSGQWVSTIHTHMARINRKRMESLYEYYV